MSNPRLSPTVDRILKFAEEEREGDPGAFVCSIHLLIGILREEKSSAACLLQEEGVTIEKLRKFTRPDSFTP